MFYGIVVRMYYAPSEHGPPHFHVYYDEFKATVDIRSCEIIEGDSPEAKAAALLRTLQASGALSA